jgi:hypothetical protein
VKSQYFKFMITRPSFQLYAFTLVQQILVFFPMLSLRYIPRRWNDDFVLFNAYDLERSDKNFWPNSLDLFLNRIQSRRYLTITSQNIYETLNQSQPATHLLFVLLWISSCLVFARLASRILSFKSSLISIMLFGSMPFRFEFFGNLQGSCYIIVILFFLISLNLAVTHKERESLAGKILSGLLITFLCYSTFLLYEVAILATPLLAFVLIKPVWKSDHVSKGIAIFTGSSLVVSSLLHIYVVNNAQQPIWNRSGVTDLSPSRLLSQLFQYYLNGTLLVSEPIYDFVLGGETGDQIRNIILPTLKISMPIFAILLLMSSFLLRRTDPWENRNQRNSNLGSSDGGVTLNNWILLSLYLILTSGVGFLTFEGNFPMRLTAVSSIGIALFVGLIFEILFKKESFLLKPLLPVCIFAISVYTLASVNGINSIVKVSKYDVAIENSMRITLQKMDKVNLPILLNLPRPICQETGWWKKNPSIWESNSGQLNIAEILGMIDGEQGDLAQITYIPKVIEWENPYYDYVEMSKQCSPGAILKSDFKDSIIPEWDPNYADSTQLAFDENLNALLIKPKTNSWELP